MTPPVYVYVLKRQERMGRLKTRRLNSVQQVMDELAKLGIDPVAARPRLLALDGVESFRSPYYGLVTVEYPVEWTLPQRMKANPFFDFLFSKPKPKVRTFAEMAPMAVKQAAGRLDRWRVELLSPEGVAVWRTHSHGGVLLNSMVLSSSPQVGGLRLNDSEAYYIEKKIDEKSWADSADRPEPTGSVAAQTHEFVLESGPYRGWTLRCVPVQRDTVAWDWGNSSPVPRRVSKANPKRNFFRSKPALAQWSVVLKGKDGSVSANADATDEDLTDVIKRVGRLGHFHAVALASYARKGDKPQMRNDDDLMVEVYAIPRSNPMSRRNPSREPTFTLFRDGEVVSRRPVDYTAMLDFLVFDAGMGPKAQSMIDSLVSGRRESIAFTLRRQRYEVTLARAGGRGGAPAAERRNPLFGYGLPPGKFSMWGRTMGRKMYHHASYDALKPETAVALLVDDLGVSSKAAVAAVQKAASGVVVKVVSPSDPHSYLNVANRGRTQAEASEFVSLVPNPRRNYSSSLFTSGDLHWSEYVPTKYGLKKSADYVRPGQDLVVYSIVKFNEKNVMGSNYGVYRTWNHKDGTTSEYAVSESMGEERAERAAQEDLDGLRRGLLSFKNPKRNFFGLFGGSPKTQVPSAPAKSSFREPTGTERWLIAVQSPEGEYLFRQYSWGSYDISQTLMRALGMPNKQALVLEKEAERGAKADWHGGYAEGVLETGPFAGHTVTISPVNRDKVALSPDKLRYVVKTNGKRNRRNPYTF